MINLTIHNMKNNNIILKNKNSCKAFTLIELAIVMIIISFLLVTMLQGHGLYK